MHTPEQNGPAADGNEPARPGSRLRVQHAILAVLALLMLAVFVWASRLAFATDTVKLDEEYHIAQIDAFASGHWGLVASIENPEYPQLAMLPGYHAITALYVKMTGGKTLAALRAFSILCLAMIGALTWHIRRHEGDSRADSLERIGMVIFFVPLFVHSMLVYTDATAMLLCLAAIETCRRRHYVLAAALMVICLLVRQNLVIVAGVLLLYGVLREGNGSWRRESLRGLPMLVPCLLFVAFFILNGYRVGLDSPDRQPTTLAAGNILISLTTLVIMFGPLLPRLCRRGFRRMQANPWLVIPLLALVVMAAVYRPQHPWNYLAYLMRNVLLYHLTATIPGRIGFVIAVAAGVLAIYGLQFRQRWDYLLVLLWPLLLLPAQLVETRYFIPALLPLIIYRSQDEPYLARYVTLVWLIMLSAMIHNIHMTTLLIL